MIHLVVTDTSCLIALDRIEHLDLLPELFEVHAPEAVAAEFGRQLAWLQVTKVSEKALRTPLLETLDRGEAEAIVLARNLPDARLLIDEARGRRVARQFGIRVTGTAGILLAAKEAGLIQAVRPLIDTLVKEHRFRLSETVRKTVLQAAGEM